jgi:transposase-like protein
MSKRTRRQYTIEQKVAILRRHLVDKVPVTDLCNEYKLQPSVFYQWMKQAMENIGAALAPRPPRPDSREKQLAAKVEQLQAKVAKKDEVIAEISAEYVQLKKELQGVHSPHRHDPRPHLAVLSAVQRQDRALAQDHQVRRHPSGAAGLPRCGPRARLALGRALQHRPPAQRHRLRLPADVLAGRAQAIWAQRDRKLEAARETRRIRRAELRLQQVAA